MPGFLLHEGASVICAHGGQARSLSPNSRVLVSGQPVVTQPYPFVVSGCPFNISGSPSPCTSAQWITGATRVKSNGMPLLLVDSQSLCIPNSTPLSIMMTQTRVTGI